MNKRPKENRGEETRILRTKFWLRKIKILRVFHLRQTFRFNAETYLEISGEYRFISLVTILQSIFFFALLKKYVKNYAKRLHESYISWIPSSTYYTT